MKSKSKHRTAAIILAAGASQRLGHPKQLVMFDDLTLLERAVIRALDSSVESVIVVLGKSAAQFQKLLQPYNVRTVINQNWSAGISSSIKAGLKALDEENSIAEREFDSALFLTCDQPFLNSQLINEILTKYESTNSLIVASAYADCLGIPVLFSREMFSKLEGLQGDNGAGRLIKEYSQSVSSVSFPSGEIDIDTAADIRHISG